MKRIGKLGIANEIVDRAVRGMAKLSAGVVGGQIIAFAALPVLTRLYAPADFGVLATFVALVTFCAPLATLLYLRAIPLPKSSIGAANVLALCLLISIAAGVATGGVLALLSGNFISPVSLGRLGDLYLLVPAGIITFAVYQSIQHWGIRRREYGLLAYGEIAQNSAYVAITVLSGLLAPAAANLLIGRVAGQSIGALTLLFRIRGEARRLAAHVSWRRIVAMARRYKDQPIYRFPSQLLLAATEQAPILYVAANYGSGAAGQFGLAMMALALPMNLIGRTMGKAYFAEISSLSAGSGAEIYRSLKSMVLVLIGAGFLIAVSLFFLAPPLFPLVFGSAWAEAGEIVAILSVYLAAQFAAAPIMNTLTVLREERVFLIINARSAIIVLAVFAASAFMELSLRETLTLFAWAMAVRYLLTILTVVRVSRVRQGVE